MQVLNKFNIDLAKKTAPIVIDAMQNDANTRIIEVHLFSNSFPWNVADGITAAVAFQKPDKHKGLYDELPSGASAITISGNTITATLAPQVLTCSGRIGVAIVLMDENLNRIATFPFFVEAEIDPSGGSDVSNDYYKYSTMEEVSKAVDSALSELETSKQDFLDKALEALEVVKDTATEDSPAIICKKTGEIISVSDSSNRNFVGLTIYGKTTQNGTPTPEAPVELVSAGASGAINTTVTGKNLFDPAFFTDNGFTETDGVYSGQSALIYNKAMYFKGFKENTVYTFSWYGYVPDIAGTRGLHAIFNYTDGTKENVAAIVSATNTKYTHSSKSGKTLDRITFLFGTNLKNCISQPMLVEGTDTEYEPYNAQTITASTPNGLPGIPVSSGGNYTDENGQQWVSDEIDFGRGVYVQRVEKKQYTGAENFFYNSRTNNVAAVITNTEQTDRVDTHILCSHFQARTLYDMGDFGGVCCRAGSNGLCFGMQTDLDLDAYSQTEVVAIVRNLFVSEYERGNPVTVVYALATPIETALSAEELAQYAALHSNKPNTTVYNDAGAGLGVEYVADTKNYIDNKFTELQNAILSAGANI